jgi:hypothetical protein
LLTLLLLLGAGVWALQRWIGTDGFKLQVEQEASTTLGVPVQLARLEVALWPLPAIAAEGLQIQTRPALTLARLELRPAWRRLMRGQLELTTVLVRGAVLPQAGLDGLVLLLQKKKLPAQAAQGPEAENTINSQYFPRHVVLDDVTWLRPQGAPITLNADAQLNPQGLPDAVSIQVLKGQGQGATAELKRAGSGHDWTLAMKVGGGTLQGTLQLQPAPRPGAEFALTGQLQTRAVEVAALASAARPVLSGRLDADTTLSVRSASLGAIAEVLQTRSTFTVRQAVVHGVDLAKAVRTVGLGRGGETALDTLAGQVRSQGRTLQLTNLVASSGVLSARGEVTVSPSRALEGRVTVDLAQAALGQAVGVPLAVGGTLDAPEVSLTRAALLGAVVGTVLMPGVGTGAGATLGDKVARGLKGLFGK